MKLLNEWFLDTRRVEMFVKSYSTFSEIMVINYGFLGALIMETPKIS